MMNFSLQEIFNEIELNRIETFLTTRTNDKNEFRVSISLRIGDVHSDKTSVAVAGEGPGFYEALNDAYQRLASLIDVLEWKPTPKAPPQPVDDDIPF